jgi:hypothetical protein
MSSITISDLQISEENLISELSDTELSVQGGLILIAAFALGYYIGSNL